MCGDAIKLTIHIAIDGVFDETTLFRYPISNEELEKAKRRVLKPYFAKLETTDMPEMPVVRVEDLFLMKLLPLRERDLLDVCLLLLESYDEFNVPRLRAKAFTDELEVLHGQRFAQMAQKIRAGDLHVEWRRQLNRLLTQKEENLILSRLRHVAKR